VILNLKSDLCVHLVRKYGAFVYLIGFGTIDLKDPQLFCFKSRIAYNIAA